MITKLVEFEIEKDFRIGLGGSIWNVEFEYRIGTIRNVKCTRE